MHLNPEARKWLLDRRSYLAGQPPGSSADARYLDLFQEPHRSAEFLIGRRITRDLRPATWPPGCTGHFGLGKPGVTST